ncbi:MAG: ComEC/Rec2 family competence protein [Phycisphaerae bacterium]|nr:ComEC/Rec2 family competence protein [Phycisphaerae bacterium]
MSMGIIGDHLVQPHWSVPVTIALFGLAACLPIGTRRRLSDRRLRVAIVLLSIAAGLARHGSTRLFPDDHIARFAQADSSIVVLTGRISSPPQIITPRADIPRAYATPPRTKFHLHVSAIDGRDGPIPASGTVMVSIKEPAPDLSEHAIIRVTGWLYRISPPQNPGAYNWAAHYRRNQILVGLTTDHADAVQVVQTPPSSGFGRTIVNVRARLRQYLVDAAFPDDEESAGVLAAMVLGRRSGVSDAMNEAFRRTGNAHFLAASGMHVAWLAFVGWGIARLLGVHYRTAAAGVAVLIVCFVVLAEPQPSILRAGIVGIAACVSIFLRGRHNSLNALAFAAIVLLIIDPTNWFRTGFQFTFLATLGLIHFCPIVSNVIAAQLARLGQIQLARRFIIADLKRFVEVGSIDPADLIVSKVQRPVVVDRFLTLMARLLAVSVSEWFLTAPLGCYYFNHFAPWGAIGTFLVAPFAMITASIGFMTMIAGTLLPVTSAIFGPLLGLSSHVMIGFVNLLAVIPGSLIDGRSPALWWVIAFYALIGTWIYGSQTIRARFRVPLRIAALTVFIWWLVSPYLGPRGDGALRIWHLAVGDGTGTVIELPNGKTIIYDFGTRSAFDAGDVALDFLRQQGIRRIDAAIISHADFDHYGAIEAISQSVPIDRIILNDQFDRFVEPNSTAAQFLGTMRRAGMPIEIISGQTSLSLCSDVDIRTIWPPPATQHASPTDNDSSIVLRIEYQGKSVLLTGDIAEFAIGGLLAPTSRTASDADNGDCRLDGAGATEAISLRADVLSLPHHGSVVSNTRAFIDAVNPSICIRSTGQRRRLTTNGIETIVGPGRRYFSTADDGCILVEIKNEELSARRAMP